MTLDLREMEHRLRDTALAFPEASEEFPWGESAFKVRGKTFLFLHHADALLSLSVKLPASHDFAEMLEFTKPTGYGLGRSGWITCRLEADTDADLDLVERWVAESYCAIAPKALSRALEAHEA